MIRAVQWGKVRVPARSTRAKATRHRDDRTGKDNSSRAAARRLLITDQPAGFMLVCRAFALARPSGVAAPLSHALAARSACRA